MPNVDAIPIYSFFIPLSLVIPVIHMTTIIYATLIIFMFNAQHDIIYNIANFKSCVEFTF